MTDLVFARNGQALTTSAIIANGVGVEHRALRQLLRNYQADFESFGVLTFEMSKPKNLKADALKHVQSSTNSRLRYW